MGKQDQIVPDQSHPRIVRYAELRPCYDAFIDTRTPGSDQKENFTIIGPGVSENPNQHVHIAEPHGFNIGGARQPPNCVNSQHSHHTAECFYIHKGTWAFRLGEHGEDAEIILKPGDFISIPTEVFRGFENIGDDLGFLWGILGGDDPGRVLWAPYVFEMAEDYGLVLMENGNLIDTRKGETVPDGQHRMPPTTAAQVGALDRLTNAELRDVCILAEENIKSVSEGGLTRRRLIGEDCKIAWPHGFTVDHIVLNGQCSAEKTYFSGPEVLFVQTGELTTLVDDEVWSLRPGDTATIPKGAARQFRNDSDVSVEFLQVRGEI